MKKCLQIDRPGKDLFVLVQTMGPFIRKACPEVSQEQLDELARLSIAQMYSEDSVASGI
jgi:hypothetical protein